MNHNEIVLTQKVKFYTITSMFIEENVPQNVYYVYFPLSRSLNIN